MFNTDFILIITPRMFDMQIISEWCNLWSCVKVSLVLWKLIFLYFSYYFYYSCINLPTQHNCWRHLLHRILEQCSSLISLVLISQIVFFNQAVIWHHQAERGVNLRQQLPKWVEFETQLTTRRRLLHGGVITVLP